MNVVILRNKALKRLGKFMFLIILLSTRGNKQLLGKNAKRSYWRPCCESIGEEVVLITDNKDSELLHLLNFKKHEVLLLRGCPTRKCSFQ